MSFEVMLLVLLGALLHATWNTSVKAAKDKILDATLMLTGSAVVIPFLLVFLPLPSVASLPYLAFSVVIHVLYFLLLVLSYQKADLSVVYPLMRGAAPAMTAMLGVLFLKEIPSLLAWFGILLVSGGTLSLAINITRRNLLVKGAGIALLNAGVIVIYTLVDGVGARVSGNAVSYTGWMMFLQAIVFVTVVLLRKQKAALNHLRENAWKGLLGGTCAFCSYSLALWAMTRAPIAHVATLRETSIVFGTILAVAVLKEQISARRVAAIIAVAVGAVLIKLS